MTSIGDKDAFPTPAMTDANDPAKTVVWPGPGLTVFEYACIHIMAGAMANPTFSNTDKVDLADVVLEQATSLMKVLDERRDNPVLGDG